MSVGSKSFMRFLSIKTYDSQSAKKCTFIILHNINPFQLTERRERQYTMTLNFLETNILKVSYNVSYRQGETEVSHLATLLLLIV